MRYVAEGDPTPAELIERLRIKLGTDGKPLSDDRLARLVGAPTRQQVIGWRKHGRGMSRRYAERFAELDGEHTADEYMVGAQVVVNAAELLDRLDRLETVVASLVKLGEARAATSEATVDRMLTLVAEQLAAQSALLERLTEVAVRLDRATAPGRASRGSGKPA